MQAHIGTTRDSKLVRTLVVMAVHVVDMTQTVEVLHGQELKGHAHAGYSGVEMRTEIVVLWRTFDWQIACKLNLIKALTELPHRGELLWVIGR